MPVFADGRRGVHLNVDQVSTVPNGARSSIPVLDESSGPWAGRTLIRPAVPETTGAFSVAELVTARTACNRAISTYRRVDAARFPVIDLALRQALNGGSEEKLDQEFDRGGRRAVDRDESRRTHAAAAVTTFATYLSSVRHLGASTAGMRRRSRTCGSVMGSATYAHAGNVSTAATNADYSALRRTRPARRAASACRRTSRRWRQPSNRTRSSGSACTTARYWQVLWQGVTILVPLDEITKAKTGEVAHHGDPAGRDEDPPGGVVLQAGNVSTPRRRRLCRCKCCRRSGLRCGRQG